MRPLLLVTLLLAGVARAASAQTTAGLPRVDGHRIPLQVDTFAVYLLRGRDTIRTGTVRDQVTSDGTNLIRVYSTTDRILGSDLDTIIDRLDDLAPVAFRGRSAEFVARINFSATAATGSIHLVNGDSVQLDLVLPHPIYGGTSFDMVARAADLREGLKMTVPAFLVESRAIASLPGEVTGSAVIDGHDCWVFRGDFGTMPVTFWIDKRTRALRRQLMQMRIDMGILFTNGPLKGARREPAS
ncbi:MAG: hypothetical protein ACHQXA_09325 [Gemmatimonadales bacterium]